MEDLVMGLQSKLKKTQLCSAGYTLFQVLINNGNFVKK